MKVHKVPSTKQDIHAHVQVRWDQSSGVAISASYDKTLRIWNVNGGRGREVACISGHAAPILEMAPHDGRIVSGWWGIKVPFCFSASCKTCLCVWPFITLVLVPCF
jgi:WD40 repeat protein